MIHDTTVCYSRNLLFRLYYPFSPRLWLFCRFCFTWDLNARHIYYLKVLSLRTRRPVLFFNAALFWHLSSSGWGKNPCSQLRAAGVVHILHQSPENASQTNVPQRTTSLFISITFSLAALWFSGCCQISSMSSCQFTLENVQLYLRCKAKEESMKNGLELRKKQGT